MWFPLAALLLATAPGCDEGTPSAAPSAKPSTTAAAPTATATATAAPKPPSMGAKKLTIDKATSKVDFLMDAPEEKIHGKADGAATGELQIDFMDLDRSTGTITVDISDLVVTQAKVDKSGKIGEETKSDKQNEHARNWLEIAPDVPEAQRKSNALVTFTIKSVQATGEKNLAKLTGPERKVPLKATGTFHLHGKDVEKTAELEATFHVEGDKPTSVTVKTLKPLPVDLAEHDVKPRDAFGKLALKTLSALSPKVAKEAAVNLEVTAKVAP
jgi:polyisoprenoid-binding protein YceI